MFNGDSVHANSDDATFRGSRSSFCATPQPGRRSTPKDPPTTPRTFPHLTQPAHLTISGARSKEATTSMPYDPIDAHQCPSTPPNQDVERPQGPPQNHAPPFPPRHPPRDPPVLYVPTTTRTPATSCSMATLSTPTATMPRSTLEIELLRDPPTRTSSDPGTGAGLPGQASALAQTNNSQKSLHFTTAKPEGAEGAAFQRTPQPDVRTWPRWGAASPRPPPKPAPTSRPSSGATPQLAMSCFPLTPQPASLFCYGSTRCPR